MNWNPMNSEKDFPKEYGLYLVTLLPPTLKEEFWAKPVLAYFDDLMKIRKTPIFWTGDVGKENFEDITDRVTAWIGPIVPYRKEGKENA